MPDYIPNHKGMVFWSGVAELIGAIGMLIPLTRIYAGWGLIALLLAVFPTNIDMFVKAWTKRRWSWFMWATLLRLPIQFWLIYWVFTSAGLVIN